MVGPCGPDRLLPKPSRPRSPPPPEPRPDPFVSAPSGVNFRVALAAEGDAAPRVLGVVHVATAAGMARALEGG